MLSRYRILAVLMGIVSLAIFAILATGATTPPDSRAAATDVHAYFNKLIKRPDKVAEYSLRDKAQLEKYKNGHKLPPAVTYDPANDTDPRKQDAAKVFVPEGKFSLPNQVRLPIPECKDGTLLATWDAWFGKEFAFSNTKIQNYKTFQFSVNNAITTEVQTRWALGKAPAIAMVSVRQYGSVDETVSMKGPSFNGVRYGGDCIGPMVGEFAIMPETWTRYWMLIAPSGESYDISLWLADEDRDAVQILDKVRIKGRGNYYDKFWLEYNTSSEPKNVPARTGYFRNLVMLKNVADPKALLERPLGSGPRAATTQPGATSPDATPATDHGK